MAQAVSFSGQAGKLMGEHLAHPHVLFVLTGCPVVLFDNPRVHDELVAHQDWLKGVNDAPFLLRAVPHFIDHTGMSFSKHRAQQASEHTVTKVAFDQHHVDLIARSNLCQRPKGVFIVPAADPTGFWNVQVAVKLLDDCIACLVSSGQR